MGGGVPFTSGCCLFVSSPAKSVLRNVVKFIYSRTRQLELEWETKNSSRGFELSGSIEYSICQVTVKIVLISSETLTRSYVLMIRVKNGCKYVICLLLQSMGNRGEYQEPEFELSG